MPVLFALYLFRFIRAIVRRVAPDAKLPSVLTARHDFGLRGPLVVLGILLVVFVLVLFHH